VSTTLSPTPTTMQAIQGLREIGREFHARGWSVGTSSNYSVVVSREPLELLVTASGKDKGRLAEADFVRVDKAGAPTVAGQPKASAETQLHTILATQPDVGAILHTHSVWGTLLSQYYAAEGGFEIHDYEMLKGLEGVTTHEHAEWVAIFDNTQDISQLATEIAKQLQDPNRRWQHGFLIRQHGLYTWGQTLFEARRHIEILEFLFECLVRKISLAK